MERLILKQPVFLCLKRLYAGSKKCDFSLGINAKLVLECIWQRLQKLQIYFLGLNFFLPDMQHQAEIYTKKKICLIVGIDNLNQVYFTHKELRSPHCSRLSNMN